MRVIPIQALLLILVLWVAIDLTDLFWLHWFPSNTKEAIVNRSFWMGALIIAGYLTSGKKIEDR